MKKITREALAQSELAGGCCKYRSTPTNYNRTANTTPAPTPPTPPTNPGGGGGVTVPPPARWA
ncbi:MULTISPECIES: hypothetical protein [Pseudomonas aeruginosa group]|uniref:Uncharacterized protein n=1 Tax=Pseudomonas paraeruginosa TaxID=2994495 RepID=A0A2R3ISW9_9PSED|nr:MULTISPECIES: hypothetical protein [Pseudomonas aeruginosa group]AVK05005.1 hypothetical protein CSB93_4693 [Pseudomonas paraeruginosa]AWE89335.1 hypothetical protein CSC28_3483 [Pseudomonas paraeruginosa]KAB0748330.1 hypothetical protein F7O94_09800 [Pseudomonas aeruginosa]MBG3902681.1 hypothetical protein [Pseudomonas aeruginosa]MBG4067485.1 hypothetical protein [Pseudomonas aeruginosa]